MDFPTILRIEDPRYTFKIEFLASGIMTPHIEVKNFPRGHTF
jgi:hypothetical protein